MSMKQCAHGVSQVHCSDNSECVALGRTIPPFATAVEATEDKAAPGATETAFGGLHIFQATGAAADTGAAVSGLEALLGH